MVIDIIFIQCLDTDTDRILNVLTRIRIGS